MKDTRDLRDPATLGEMLNIEALSHPPGTRYSTVYDKSALVHGVPDYSHTESVVEITSREYREKQIALAEAGDLESARLCKQKGWAYVEHQSDDLAARDEETLADAVDLAMPVDTNGQDHVWWREKQRIEVDQSAVAVKFLRCEQAEPHRAHQWRKEEGVQSTEEDRNDLTVYYVCPGHPPSIGEVEA